MPRRQAVASPSSPARASQTAGENTANHGPSLSVNGKPSLIATEIGSTHPSRPTQPETERNFPGAGNFGSIGPPCRDSRRYIAPSHTKGAMLAPVRQSLDHRKRPSAGRTTARNSIAQTVRPRLTRWLKYPKTMSADSPAIRPARRSSRPSHQTPSVIGNRQAAS